MNPAGLPEGFVTRPMTHEDLDQVMPIEAACYPIGWARSIFERELGHTLARMDVVCDMTESEALAGYLVYWIVHDELHILNVAVSPDYQRRGLARAMLGRVMTVCHEQRLQYVALEVRVSNEAAINLYQGFGFKRIGQRKKYYADNGEDALVMALVLSDSEASV